MKDLSAIYNVLSEVYKNGAYVNLALNSMLNSDSSLSSAFITRTVYGVLDKEFELEHRIKTLTSKTPKIADKILLKIGIFLIIYSDKANYAVLNSVVNYAKKLKKNPAFINAVLRKAVEGYVLPSGKFEAMSISFNLPQWVVERLVVDYGEDVAINIMSNRGKPLTHIRLLPDSDTQKNRDKLLIEGAVPTDFGYYVTHSIMSGIDMKFRVQGLGSSAVCYAAKVNDGFKVLDLCSAPGGKSVDYALSARDVDVVACDIHEHRVELIKSYAGSCGVNLTTVVNDATKFNPALFEFGYKNMGFDVVSCDVPCSGFGVLNSRPDVVLRRKPEDITQLAELQYNILSTSSKYVRKGGVLMYSTCTYLYEENSDVVNKFLASAEGADFVVEPVDARVPYISAGNYAQLAPFASDGAEGFFFARLRRV